MARPVVILTLLAACGAPTTPKPEDSDTPKVVDTFVETPDTDEGGGNGGGGNGIIQDTDTDEPAPVCAAPTDTKLASACDLSVNSGTASVPTAGGPLVLQVTSTTTPVAGLFNGGGRDGNLALAGFHGFSKEKLSPRASVRVVAKHTTADSLKLEVRLIVDLGCTGARIVQLVLDTSTMASTPDTDGYLAYSADASKPVWFALNRLQGASDVLLWGRSDLPADGAVAKTLDDLLAEHPDACLRNVNNVAFRDMPKGDVISSALLSLGDSLDARASSRWEVREATWGATTFLP